MEERELSIYTDAIRDAIESIPEEFVSMSEKQLRELVRPSYQNYQLKQYLWDEIARATLAGTKMIAGRVFEKMYSRQHFYTAVLKNKKLMAWMMTPVVEYENKAKAALDKVSERYEELISMEITTERRVKGADGEYSMVRETDPKKALVLLQVIKNLEERVKGSSIQRQVSISSNTPSTAGGEELALDMSSIEAKLKELEHKVNPFDKRGKSVHNEETRDNEFAEDGIPSGVDGDIETESVRLDTSD